MWVHFAHGVIKGEYDDKLKLIFLAMIQATVASHD